MLTFKYQQSQLNVEVNTSRYTVAKRKIIFKPVFIGLLRDDNAKVKLKKLQKV
jgi:hypothetical protein